VQIGKTRQQCAQLKISNFGQPVAETRYRGLCVVSPFVALFFNTHSRNEYMNIYVGNLSYNTSEADLRTAFAEYGEVTSVSVITDRATGQSKGFAFVELGDDASGEAAISALNESAMDGRNLTVNKAKPRADRAPRERTW
jgi:hypothetical protein